LSCDPGRDKWNTVMGTFVDPDTGLGSLYWLDYGRDLGKGPKRLQLDGMDKQKRMDLHPLGIAYYEPSKKLYVVNHAKQGPSIEVFTLSGGDGELKATFDETITSPLIRTPNSIAPISDDEILVTNDHAIEVRFQPLLAQIETYLAYPGGSVVYHNHKSNETKVLANIPFANGIEFLNTTHVAVASTSTPSVNIYAWNSTLKTLSPKQKLYPPFLPDNLSVDGNGILLIAGHPYAPALTNVAKTNREFDLDGRGEGKPEKERPRALTWVAEWDGNAQGVLKDLYVGTEYGTGSQAARDVEKGIGFVVGLYEKGIFVWKE
jgi:arylesterase / paraoxonase